MCSSSQVQAFYDACLGTNVPNATCSSWQSANATCDASLEGDESSSGTNWGPLVYWATDSIININLGGCVILDGESSTCGKDLQYLSECEHAACDQSCAHSTFTDFESCQTAADANECLTQSNAVNSACGFVTSQCFSDPTNDFEGQFLSVAKVFCE